MVRRHPVSTRTFNLFEKTENSCFLPGGFEVTPPVDVAPVTSPFQRKATMRGMGEESRPCQDKNFTARI